MKESQVQELLLRRARARNWAAWKTRGEGTKGFPDVVIAGPRVAFIEVKRWNRTALDPAQERVAAELRRARAFVEKLVGGFDLEETHLKIEELLDRIGEL